MTARRLQSLLVAAAFVFVNSPAFAGGLPLEALSRVEAAVRDGFGGSAKGVEGRLAEFERNVAGFVRVPNLHIDTGARDLRLEVLKARTAGGLTVDVESRSHMGRLPTASVALRDRATSAALRVDAAPDRGQVLVGGSWSYRAASLRGAVDGRGRCEAGLSVALSKTQSLDYSMKTGPATDHRIGWSLRVSL